MSAAYETHRLGKENKSEKQFTYSHRNVNSNVTNDY